MVSTAFRRLSAYQYKNEPKIQNPKYMFILDYIYSWPLELRNCKSYFRLDW